MGRWTDKGTRAADCRSGASVLPVLGVLFGLVLGASALPSQVRAQAVPCSATGVLTGGVFTFTDPCLNTNTTCLANDASSINPVEVGVVTAGSVTVTGTAGDTVGIDCPPTSISGQVNLTGGTGTLSNAGITPSSVCLGNDQSSPSAVQSINPPSSGSVTVNGAGTDTIGELCPSVTTCSTTITLDPTLGTGSYNNSCVNAVAGEVCVANDATSVNAVLVGAPSANTVSVQGTPSDTVAVFCDTGATPTATPTPTPTPTPTSTPTPTPSPTPTLTPTPTPTPVSSPTPIGTTLTVTNTSCAPRAGFSAVATLGPMACASGQQVLFTFQRDIVAATTNSSGVASALFFCPVLGGTYSIEAAFAGTATCGASSGVGLLTDLGPTPTATAVPTATPTPTGPTPTPNPSPSTTLTVANVTAQEGAVFLAAAGLGPAPCEAGQSITFTFVNSGTFQQVAITGSNGVASVTFGAPITPGQYTIQASFAGSAGCAPSTGTGTLTVPIPTPTTLTVANVSASAGSSFVASATISPPSCALGQSLGFTFDGSSASSVTNTSGTATHRFPVPNTPGFLPIQASFGGNPNCGPSAGTGMLTISGQITPVTLLPNSVSFSTQALGSQSSTQEIVLANRQSVPMKVTSVSITGGKGTFAEADNCVGTLAPKSTCTISVAFAPSATSSGKQTASLQVHDSLNATASGASSHPQKVSLSGMGVAAATAQSSGLSFGAQTVGTISKPKAVTITNNLGVQLAFTNVATSGDFVITGSKCSTEIAKKSSCTVNVAFKPAATGRRTGTLTINDDASPLPVTVSLSGTGK